MTVVSWMPVIAAGLTLVGGLFTACLVWVVRTLVSVGKTLAAVQGEIETRDARLKALEDRIAPLENMRQDVAAMQGIKDKIAEMGSVKDRLGTMEVHVGRIDERTQAMVTSTQRIETTLTAALTTPTLRANMARAAKAA